MRWGKMCIQDISWEKDHHSPILVENANVWRISKYIMIYSEGLIKMAHCKKKI